MKVGYRNEGFTLKNHSDKDDKGSIPLKS